MEVRFLIGCFLLSTIFGVVASTSSFYVQPSTSVPLAFDVMITTTSASPGQLTWYIEDDESNAVTQLFTPQKSGKTFYVHDTVFRVRAKHEYVFTWTQDDAAGMVTKSTSSSSGVTHYDRQLISSIQGDPTYDVLIYDVNLHYYDGIVGLDKYGWVVWLGPGRDSWDDFVAADALTRFLEETVSDKSLTARFHRLDADSDGFLTMKEYTAPAGDDVVRNNEQLERVRSLFEMQDLNSDGKVQYTEYVAHARFGVNMGATVPVEFTVTPSLGTTAPGRLANLYAWDRLETGEFFGLSSYYNSDRDLPVNVYDKTGTVTSQVAGLSYADMPDYVVDTGKWHFSHDIAYVPESLGGIAIVPVYVTVPWSDRKSETSIIAEVDVRAGKTVQAIARYNLGDFLDESSLTACSGPPPNLCNTNPDYDPGYDEWTHANSIAKGPENHWMLSARHLSAIFVFHKDGSSGLLHTISGVIPSEYTYYSAIGDDVDPVHYNQHSVSMTHDGTIVMIDNGNARGDGTELWSRACEYEVDWEKKTMTLVWQHVPGFYTQAAGGIRKMKNGNFLVSYSCNRAGEDGNAKTCSDKVYEVNSITGEEVASFDIPIVSHTYSGYRATPIASIWGEVGVDASETAEAAERLAVGGEATANNTPVAVVAAGVPVVALLAAAGVALKRRRDLGYSAVPLEA